VRFKIQLLRSDKGKKFHGIITDGQRPASSERVEAMAKGNNSWTEKYVGKTWEEVWRQCVSRRQKGGGDKNKKVGEGTERRLNRVAPQGRGKKILVGERGVGWRGILGGGWRLGKG